MATRYGIAQAVQTYRYGATVPLTTTSAYDFAEWDRWDARQFRYLLHDLYYFNAVFTTLERFRTQHLAEQGLYKHTRAIYNPVWRLVKLTAAKCYGGHLDWNDMSGGAVPIVNGNPRIHDALRALWKASNFGAAKMRYARGTVRYGDGFIKLVDDTERGKVRLEFLHPGLVSEMTVDAVGHVKRIVIEYERLDPESERPYLYREEIDKERFATYRDNEPYAFYTDAAGNPVSEWDNPYGFVPVVHVKAEDIGRDYGAATFHATLDKIDQANSLASLIHDQVRKTVNVAFLVSGAQSIKQLGQMAVTEDEHVKDRTDLDEIPIITAPAGAQPHELIAHLDLAGALRKLEMQLDEIERDLPELSLHRMREFAQHSAPAVMLVFSDAFERLEDVRSNLDAALLRAFQMAISIGGLRGYEGYEGFGIDDYDKGNLDFQIGDRPLVRDTLSVKERLDLLQRTEAPARWIWRALNVPDEDIAAAELESITRERAVAGEVARVLATGALAGGEEE